MPSLLEERNEEVDGENEMGLEVRLGHVDVTDGDNILPVVYTGILPDLFRENQAVVATGRMDGNRFVAEEVLAKHDETYMP